VIERDALRAAVSAANSHKRRRQTAKPNTPPTGSGGAG
jgi:hypothetical protein